MRTLHAVILLGALFAGPSHADMWECEEPGGGKRFTNVKSDAKGCKQIIVTPNVVTSPSSTGGSRETRSPESFPKVAPQVQQQRDNDRRKILENELANEEKLLAQAKKSLSEQEAIRDGGERNYQRVLDRLEPYQKKVKLHEDNIANLKKEMGNLR